MLPRFSNEFADVLGALINQMEKIYSNAKLHKNLLSNSSILIGKLGKSHTGFMSQKLPSIMKKVCIGFICSESSDPAIFEGLKGLNQMIISNPSLALNVIFHPQFSNF